MSTPHSLFVSFLTTALALQEAALPLAPLTAVRRMLAIVSVPMSMVVFAIYWPLVLFAPSLMAPADMAVDEQGHPSPAALMFPLPLGIDLGLHAVPVIILLTDWAVYGKRYSRFEATRVAPLIAIAMGCSYGTWVEWCASANGAFPYPFLNILFVGRLSIYATATLFAFSAFRWVNSMHPASRAITR
ncbi:FAR-17a/AIG1-like protein [Auriculariales sp. MPI-PUGE-AT-0066]|nr:FAR-17a/AIG1-like protein [Auriculariales sp. MPI-PUGE-AT-0066]